jgi:hypothetical protein
MTGKELFKIWAPAVPERWTKFAKPALFVHVAGFSMTRRVIDIPKLPMEIFKHRADGTAFIVDLPGALGVEGGLALAELGFRPVPLYNGINEQNIGGLTEAVNNTPIIDALIAPEALQILNSGKISHDALPVFMLDANRNVQIPISPNIYDNRWSIEPEDMPDAFYLKEAGVKRVAVWSKGDVRADLLPIINNYRAHGIEIIAFCDDKTMRRENNSMIGQNIAANPGYGNDPIMRERFENVRIFENARNALMLIAGMAIVNFISMFFFSWERPLLYTAPSLMWLTYLWSPESISPDALYSRELLDITNLWLPELLADMIAILFIIAYGALYFLTQKKRQLMKAATIFYGIDVAVMFVYAFAYGIFSYIGWFDEIEVFLFLAALVYGFPILCMVFLIKGLKITPKVQHLSDEDYSVALDALDGIDRKSQTLDTFSQVFGGRRHFRGFRGYYGYGGSGLGGYGGRGYSGGRGGFGG